MQLPAAVSYALAAIIQLSHDLNTPPIPCYQLAKAGGMPEQYLIQALRRLVEWRILRSVRGVHGGFHLARPADQINLAEIVEAFQGPLVRECDRLEGLAPARARFLADELRDSAQQYRNRLAAIRLSDLQEKPKRRVARSAG